MTGSSIAAPDAAGWITDFLNAAYYRREPERRDVDDLRLAFGDRHDALAPSGHRRLRLGDAAAFIAAFGREPFVDGARWRAGRSSASSCWRAPSRLLGPWFPCLRGPGAAGAGGSPLRVRRSAGV